MFRKSSILDISLGSEFASENKLLKVFTFHNPLVKVVYIIKSNVKTSVSYMLIHVKQYSCERWYGIFVIFLIFFIKHANKEAQDQQNVYDRLVDNSTKHDGFIIIQSPYSGKQYK